MRHLIKFVLTGLILSLALSAPVQASDSAPQSTGTVEDGDNQAPAWPPIWWPGGG